MISAGLILIYALLALLLIGVFINIKVYKQSKNDVFLPVSIIICARNEEAYLEKCLQSLISQHYPRQLMEIILVNDASSDKTFEIAQRVLDQSGLAYSILNNDTQLGKKESIRKAVSVSRHEWLVTRDADTFTGSDLWLQNIMSFASGEKKQFVIAPVMVSGNKQLLTFLQKAESYILMMLTASTAKIGKPFLCSGANLAFTKTIFSETGAYSSHLNIASGDDVLFLEDVKRLLPEAVGYLHSTDALVYTYAEKRAQSLFKQRIRWASKVFVNNNRINLGLAVFIVLINAFFILNLLNLLMNGSINALIFVVIKLVIDNLLVFLAARFLKETFQLLHYTAAGICYPFYALTVAAGSFFKNPKWK